MKGIEDASASFTLSRNPQGLTVAVVGCFGQSPRTLVARSTTHNLEKQNNFESRVN